MTSLIHIADRVLNRPLLVTRDKAQVVLSVLAGRIGVNSPEASRFVGESFSRDEDGRPSKDLPYRVANGVAIITITGSLVNRGAWVGASSGLTSYEGIGHQLKTAAADQTVKAVILDLQSPGGEAIGAFETAALVRQLSAKKRTVALVNGMAASAAYAIASGASEIVTTETGVSGSIGVVLLHADFSRQLDRDGITPTLIHAGAHKVDGNPFEPLTDDVRDDLQAEVNSFYEAFLSTVAQGRGARLTVEKARSTEAKTFIGKAAVEAGVADRVGTFETVLADLSRASGRTTVQNRRTSMDTTDQPGADAKPGTSQADHTAALAAARTEGETAGKKLGAQEERQRISAILTCESAQGREAAAIEMALDEETSFTASTADKMLARLPKNGAGASSKASLANRLSATTDDETDALGTSDQPAAKGGRLTSLAKQMHGATRDAR
jgi:capsid assembly protease